MGFLSATHSDDKQKMASSSYFHVISCLFPANTETSRLQTCTCGFLGTRRRVGQGVGSLNRSRLFWGWEPDVVRSCVTRCVMSLCRKNCGDRQGLLPMLSSQIGWLNPIWINLREKKKRVWWQEQRASRQKEGGQFPCWPWAKPGWYIIPGRERLGGGGPEWER